MINKIRTILRGTSLTERDFDKCTKELYDLFNVSGSLFSDTVIDDEAWNRYQQNIYNDGEDSIFAEGARWMMEKIKQELAKK